MREKLFTFLLHIKKFIAQIVCCHLVATGRFFISFINNHGKQRKMLKKPPVANGWLQTFVINFIVC